MSEMVLRFYAPAGIIHDRSALPPEGAFLESYDVEAHDGQGEARWTLDPARALRFVDGKAAFEAWTAQSRRRPFRPDGKPNKPLTAYTIMVEAAP